MVLLASIGAPDARAAAPERAETPAEPAAAAPRSVRAAAPVFTGRAFDTCSAPPLAVMRAWWQSSPYGAAGIYIGGPNRACDQTRLNSGWVRSVDRLGWRLLPVYVGSQAPCVLSQARQRVIDPRGALAQGRAEGADAVRSASALGLLPRSAIYLDIENYRRGDTGCRKAVLQYTSAWNRAVRNAGYVPGFYSSDNSGIADLAAAETAAQARSARRSAAARGPAAGRSDRTGPGRGLRTLPQRRTASPAGAAVRAVRGGSALPEAIWYARWDAHAGTGDSDALGPGQWTGHRRIHQYRGNVQESHGGLALRVDRDAVDAPVAVVR